jgi:WD and tetratricopeptide repeat-containing protein 1
MQRYDSPNVLLSLDARGPRRPLELKALALNPVRPNELAVAAADEQVRIYDRRRLSLGAPRAGGAPPPPPLLQLAPPHLAPGGPGGARVHTTAVAFGNAGDKIVASYHSDHAYTWDTLAAAPAEPSAALPTPSGRAGGRVAVRAAAPPAPDLFSHAANGLWSLLDPGRGARSAIPGLLPPGADRERAEGDAAVLQRRFFDAVQHFTEALYLAPTCAALYSSRAGALLRRGWRGDAFAALRDCEASLALDPGSRRALLRRAQALHACGLLAAAQAAARLHRAAFGGDDELLTLEDEVAAGLRQRAQQDEARREQQEQQRNIRRRRGFSRERRQRRRSSAGGGDAASSEEASPAASEPAAARFMPSAGTAAGQEASRSDEMELESHASSEEDDDDAPAGASPSAIDAYDQAYAAAIERAAAAAAAKPGGSIGPPPPPPGAPHPSLWAALPGGARLLRRFVGHCNQQTDIKEACFLGGDDALVAAGSDDGRVFIYAAATGALVRVLQADADVANCVRPHPHLPVLATSGIESVVKLWSPEGPEQAGGELAALAAANQDRVRELRTQEVFLGQGLRLLEMLTESNAALVMGGGEADGGAGEGQAAGEGDGGGGGPGVVQCRMA